MRPRYFVAVVLLAVFHSPVFAQDQTPRLEDLKAPSTAASVLLGTSPTSIERPDNPKALVLNLVTRIATDDGVPANYGVAVTPYWMRWHPKLTFDSYAKPTFVQSIARSFSISFASSDWTEGSGNAAQDLGSRVSTGFSSVLYQGRVDPLIFELKTKLEQNLQALTKALEGRQKTEAIEALKARRKILQAEFNAAKDPDAVVKAHTAILDVESALKALIAVGDSAIAALHAERRELASAIQKLDSNRYGGRIGVAAAWSWSVPDDAFGDASRDRSGFWVTPSYRWRLSKPEVEEDDAPGDQVVEENDFGVPQPAGDETPIPVSGLEPGAIEIVGAVRYLREPEPSAETMRSGWDLGARLVWQIRNELAVSGELVSRKWRSASIEDTYRASAIFEARLGQSAYLFAAFGRDYEEKGTRRTLVSMVGINIGVGSKPVLTF